MFEKRIYMVVLSLIVFILVPSITASAATGTQAWLDNNTLYVQYGDQKQMVDMEVYEAIVSPDGNSIIYAKRTGGGKGDTGRSLFIYDPSKRLREPLFQFTDIIKSLTWVKRLDRDFILYTRGKSGSIGDDMVVLFDLGTRGTLISFPGTIKGTIPGGGVSYTTYEKSGKASGEYEFYVDEFIDHTPVTAGAFINASSQLESSATDYSPMQAFDGNWRTAWIEGIEGDGVGEWVNVKFPKPTSIKKIYIITGFHKTHADFGDLFKMNSRLKAATIEFDGGKKIDVNFADTKLPQLIDLGDKISTSTFKLTIKEAYTGEQWKDLCISEIIFQ